MILPAEPALNRRDLLKTFGSGFLVLLVPSAPLALAQESGQSRNHHEHGSPLPQDVSAWLHIDSHNNILVFTGKAEVGQNIRTSLTQAVADELRTNPGVIQLLMADTALTPFDFGTFGSRTTPTMAPQLRKMAATAREQMITTAAQTWKLSRAGLIASNGFIIDKASGRKASFGEIAAPVNWVKVLGVEDCITPVDQRQYSGKDLPKINAADFVTGKHQYTSDLKRPGLLHGRILRPPSFGAKLLSLDATQASKIPGARVVHDGDFVGVVAPDEFIAGKALAALQPTWQQHPQISSAELFAYLPANPTESDRSRDVHPVSPEQTAPAPHAAKQLRSTYDIAYIAH
ncbi:MAG TPA: molybdopterin cofactor-binding domain-containing protein, partial [Candidatus Dormibacteraeota bacterium]|nr:molybdopterin cofactor-binding domain-containing protein [Candidatus Dormibacteraeota bacterium]